MGGEENPTTSSNENTTAKTDTSTCTHMMPTYTFLPNLIVKNATISTGGGGNRTVSPNINKMKNIQIQRINLLI